jgi:hypothetical protein
VFAADTGVPLRRAQIQAVLAGGRPLNALTDAEGLFELRDLPPGSWMLRASKAGFVAQQHGARSPFSAAEPLTVTDRQQYTVNFALARGGVITGRIFDDLGEPVANARVAAFRVQWTADGRRLSATGSPAVTDDTGAYRVYGLAPGAYYVGVNAQASSGLVTPEGRVTYSTVYFPGTPDLSTAERVIVAAAQEASGMHISFSPVRAVRIRGVVLGSAGTPVRANLRLQMAAFADGPPSGRSSTVSAADGTFELTDISPGTYTVEVTGRARSAADSPEVASVPLNVGGEDITGLVITTGGGASVSGTIVTDNSNKPVDLATMRVSAPPAQSTQQRTTPRAQVTAAGAFELRGLIGAHSLRIDSLLAGWSVRSIVVNGIDVTDRPMEFRGTEQASARIVLTDRAAGVSGTVRSDRETRGSMVVVFTDDETKWSSVSRYLRTTRVGEGGQFSIRPLPPGSRYLAVALDYVETGEQFDPDFLRRATNVATSFTLGEGEMKAIELPLVARQ